jgi:hypothetical protein
MWVIIRDYYFPLGSLTHLPIDLIFRTEKACREYMRENNYGEEYAAFELQVAP